MTTFVAQDYGPVWNLGANPADCLATAWAALESVPINVAFLVRASSSRPEGVEESLAAGGAGLKIHEDVAAGPEQLRCALDVADRHDVQLAIHTDGLNEALLAADTARVLDGRTVHLYHIEGVGGGHAPDLLSLAGRERFLTSSTNPTVPFGVGAEAEHLAMVAAVHVLEPGTRPGDATILRERVRPWTMAAESVLHDLGVIPILSSDSQGMGRVGETLRRAFQCAAVMKAQRGAGPGPDDNERVLRYLAKVTINPAIAHGLSAGRGFAAGRPPGRSDAVVARALPRPARARAQGGHAGVGRLGRRQRDHDDGRAGQRPRPQIAATGAAPGRGSLAFLAAAAMGADLPITRARASRLGLPPADRRRHGAKQPHRHRRGRRRPPHRQPGRRAAHLPARRRGALLRPLPAVNPIVTGWSRAIDSRRNNPTSTEDASMKRLGLTLGLAAIALAVLAAPAFAKTRNVWPGHSIQKAVNRAHPGDTVLVHHGTYHQTVAITQERHQPGRAPRDAAPARPPDRALRPGERAGGQRHLRARQLRLELQRRSRPRPAATASPASGSSTSPARGSSSTTSPTRASRTTSRPGTATTASSGSSSTAAATSGTSRTTTPRPASTWATRRTPNYVIAHNVSFNNEFGIFVRHSAHGVVRDNQVWGNCIGVFFLDDGQPGGEHNLTLSHNKSWANDKACAASDDGPAVSGIGVLLLGAQHSTVHDNTIRNNVASGPSPFSGGLLLLSAGPGHNAAFDTVTGNHLSGNAPFDILWDGAGAGNVFSGNSCATSSPSWICS